MGFEIERKWLIEKIPERILSGISNGEYSHSSITQGYICTDPVIRIRKDKDEFWLTFKGRGKVNRIEHNLPLGEEAYLKLLPKCDGFILRKERYRIPDADDPSLVIELDIFSGDYEGLIYAEVEFPSEGRAFSYIPPDWFGRELTFEKGWSNASLSLAKPDALC